MTPLMQCCGHLIIAELPLPDFARPFRSLVTLIPEVCAEAEIKVRKILFFAPDLHVILPL